MWCVICSEPVVLTECLQAKPKILYYYAPQRQSDGAHSQLNHDNIVPLQDLTKNKNKITIQEMRFNRILVLVFFIHIGLYILANWIFFFFYQLICFQLIIIIIIIFISRCNINLLIIYFLTNNKIYIQFAEIKKLIFPFLNNWELWYLILKKLKTYLNILNCCAPGWGSMYFRNSLVWLASASSQSSEIIKKKRNFNLTFCVKLLRDSRRNINWKKKNNKYYN